MSSSSSSDVSMSRDSCDFSNDLDWERAFSREPDREPCKWRDRKRRREGERERFEVQRVVQKVTDGWAHLVCESADYQYSQPTPLLLTITLATTTNTTANSEEKKGRKLQQ